MRRRVLALGAAVVVAAAACSSPSHRADPPTTVAPMTTAPAGPNPDIVPTVITPAYVDAVFKLLNHLNGDATRSLVSSMAVGPPVTEDLEAVYATPLLTQEMQAARQAVGSVTANVRRPPGDIITTVERLISSSSTCIFVQTTSDFSQVLLKPTPPAASEYWRLSRKGPSDDPRKLNPTPWMLTFNAVFLKPTTISDQCAKS